MSRYLGTSKYPEPDPEPGYLASGMHGVAIPGSITLGKKTNAITIVGHDLSASVDVRTEADHGTVDNNILGPHGLNNRNVKGDMAINFLQQQNLRVMSTYFPHDNYTMHTSQFHNHPNL
jgi:hypothetical protein